MVFVIYLGIKGKGGENMSCGYTLKREIVDVLLAQNPQISEDQIQEAGGGVVVLVLSVGNARRLRLYRLAKDLNFHSRYSAARAVAVSMRTEQGRAWEVISLSYLKGLADEAASVRSQLTLETAVRHRV
ncbi:hypothetical protein ACFWOT_09290 [Streptomyces sp. NPDC058440]|uniref:hypothetical protein n=1 Tax=Streptomyces sp. NPDC058440 TaxID=3346501 RepID=UPI00364EA31A